MFYSIIQQRDRDQDRQNDADAELETARQEADSFSFGLKRELTNTRLQGSKQMTNSAAPHGDNCFLQDEGEYAKCFCGKDSIEAQSNRIQRFENVSCSQCGGTFGPGEHGFSHCDNHQGMPRTDSFRLAEMRRRFEPQAK